MAEGSHGSDADLFAGIDDDCRDAGEIIPEDLPPVSPPELNVRRRQRPV